MTSTPELLSNLAERRYSETLQRLVNLDSPNRKIRPDRTGTGTYSLPGVQLVYPANPLPILSGKKVFTQSAIRELCWMLRGETNTATVGSKIWREWADENGELGPIYGRQWRFWAFRYQEVVADYEERYAESGEFVGAYPVKHKTTKRGNIDQIAKVIQQLKDDPWSRKIIVSAWNVSQLDQMALTPCHAFFQFRTSLCGTKVDLILTQPSGDMFLGVPFNKLNYAALLTLVCWAVGKEPGWIYHNIGDCHLYSNHLEQAREYLSNEPRHCSPMLEWAGDVTEERKSELFSNAYIDIQANELKIKGYEPGPAIRAKISV